jgi:Organic solute transporter Ostalpha
VIIRPSCSIASIICEKLDVLCHSAGYTFRFAAVYIEIINFVSISIALYGLLVFYGLMADELKGKRPGAKFLAIKLIVMFTFYQTFMVSRFLGYLGSAKRG